MTREEYKTKRCEINEAIESLRDEEKELYNSYLTQLIDESGFKLNEQYVVEDKLWGGNKVVSTKVWITGFRLNYTHELLATLNKVKVDGTNGKQSYSSYGVSVDRLIKVEE